jgi:hypothetical protein
MEKLSKLAKIFLFLCVLSGILWFGGYTLRLFLTFQLYEPKELILKPFLNSGNIPAVIIAYNTAVIFTFVLFPIFLLTFILTLVTSKVSLKKEGWLFIILLIVFITAPFEIYLMIIDFNVITKVFHQSLNSTEVINLYTKRLTILSSFSLIEIFSYCGIIFLLLFKPLRKIK